MDRPAPAPTPAKDLTHSGSFPLSAVTSARLPQVTFTPRIIYGQGQDTRAHSSWPSPGPPRTTNKVTGGGELDPDLVKQLGRQISTTAKPDTLAQLSLEGRNETNRISVDLPNQR